MRNALRRERTKQRQRLTAIQKDTADEVTLLLRLRDITTTMASRINSQLGLVAIGVETPWGAAAAVSRILKSGGAAGGRRRAMTIIRTELGRA